MCFSLRVVLDLGVLTSLSSCEAYYSEDVFEEGHGYDLISSDQLRGLHKVMDDNQDGLLSLDEILKFSESAGKVSMQSSGTDILGDIDQDGDSRVSLEEHMSQFRAHFDRAADEENISEAERRRYESEEERKFRAADLSGDGLLDSDELTGLFFPELNPNVLQIQVASTLRDKDKDGNQVLDMMEFWGLSESEASAEDLDDFAVLDLDRDGVLNLEELTPWESGRHGTVVMLQKLLNVADDDRDGFVTAAELVNARQLILTSDLHFELLGWADNNEL
mmetsp:Transcript_37676/g.100246  ORF Transcript_37676/g.100246 Transcript_37676/m.100246 type:complete len:277 (-) Transcript_37676:361-1191(-)